MKLLSFARLILASLVLGGCSAGSDAIMQSMQAIWSRNDASQARLNPNYRYIRVVADGRVAMLAMGDLDGPGDKPIEVWYSAQREVLRFQNGRMVGAVGLTSEWRTVRNSSFPDWEVLAGMKEFRWSRVRDVMPGYRMGVRDELLLRRVDVPSGSQLQGIAPSQLTWFEESVIASTLAAKLPPARYAVDFQRGKPVVVYGEQCLDAELCFSWQLWSAKGVAG